MGVLTDAFTAVAASLTPEKRRNEAQKFTQILRHIEFENGFLGHAKTWLSKQEIAEIPFSLKPDLYFDILKEELSHTGFDMTKFDRLCAHAKAAYGSLSHTGAMQRQLQEGTAPSELSDLAGYLKDIAKAVAATDSRLADLRDRVVAAQRAAYLMHRPMM